MIFNLFRHGKLGGSYAPKPGTSRIYFDAAGRLMSTSNIAGTISQNVLADGPATTSVVSAELAIASATALTTATAKTITSVALTPGTWDITGQVHFIQAAATCTLRRIGIHTATNTLPAVDLLTYNDLPTTTANATISLVNVRERLVVTVAGTYYLVGSATFSAGTITAAANLKAKRVA